ncbi:MAG: DUF1844 domain-containing protein [Pseudomonadota bacterium]
MENNEVKIEFSTFLMSLASAAYCSLGLAPNPITQKTEKNMVAAKQQISILEILKEKTKGNLNKEEDALIESMLYQLHMLYVKCADGEIKEGVKDGEKKS